MARCRCLMPCLGRMLLLFYVPLVNLVYAFYPTHLLPLIFLVHCIAKGLDSYFLYNSLFMLFLPGTFWFPGYLSTGVDSLQMGMNDHLLFAGTTTGFVYCWDLRTHQELWRIRAHRSVVTSMHSQAYAPSTLLTGSMDGVVKLFDCNSGTMLKAFKPICEPPSVHSASSTPNVLNAQRLQTQQSSTTQAPILCARLGMTQVLTSHTDGTLALCKSSI
jgi:WD40 repeat protein